MAQWHIRTGRHWLNKRDSYFLVRPAEKKYQGDAPMRPGSTTTLIIIPLYQVLSSMFEARNHVQALPRCKFLENLFGD